ncbi:hypothetical protein JAAARDRAFT_202842 [Jaapia argillacea MUCL 33604]|uniref:AB hydrolase-1 domain-containing protein n=1 Tax=Jaapia argillacea MUCL 33604 TaxID=933084 RepID=A0A067QIP6_9AGAM|nr:hypothetical protein JAAARDRAFT_202842 [Jaapia argillacea MUCL 33604]
MFRHIRGELASYSLYFADKLTPVINAVKAEVQSVSDSFTSTQATAVDIELALSLYGMDPSSYKNVRTYRGVHYHYFASPAKGSKPTLLFLHGFPCTSWDWRHQVAYFKQKGYGLIVPDMLGYGGTDKPTDPEYYRPSFVCQDIVTILDNEDVEKVVVIGHDWGAKITSRLASYYPDRFLAFAFLAVGYLPPSPNLDIQQMLTQSKELLGYELFGYWNFFSSEGADRIIENNMDSFISIMFPQDPELTKTDIAPLGALKAWLLANKRTARAPFMTEEEVKIQSSLLLKGGMEAPLCWYKVMTSGINADDDKQIPTESYSLPAVPSLFIGCTRDYICLFQQQKETFEKFATGETRVLETDADHWVMLSHKEVVNRELEGWVERSVVGLRSKA